MMRTDMRDVAELFEPVKPGFSLKRLLGHEHVHLVISPHPDDDVIGAGGMMALLAGSRRPVVVVYVTSGAPAGRSGSDVIRVRRCEALEALRIIRARGAFFLPFTSQDVRATPARVQALLVKIIRCAAPQALYLPSPFERHATHRAVTHMVVGGMRRQYPYEGELWGYSVWSTLFPSSLVKRVDISRVAHLKRRAIERHVSQVAVKDYAGGVLGLNRHTAVFNSILPHRNDIRYVEQFLDMRMLVRERRMSIERFARQAFFQAITDVDAQSRPKSSSSVD
jgi:LmbE family N-acetylglucosaminyl deacetylase